ncbi:MAG: ribosome silencing factor [Leptospiraceae bacterium]|nr:ribosome silencing factor [Leptospiraceae bacterium]
MSIPEQNKTGSAGSAASESSRSSREAETQAMLELARDIARVFEEKKARDTLIMDLQKVNPYFCYFVITTATSVVHLRSLARDVFKQFGQLLPEKTGLRPNDVDSGWVILDFIDVVVHIFLDEQRRYYNLERLWGDAGLIEENR